LIHDAKVAAEHGPPKASQTITQNSFLADVCMFDVDVEEEEAPEGSELVRWWTAFKLEDCRGPNAPLAWWKVNKNAVDFYGH
jgi:hypothetical protein